MGTVFDLFEINKDVEASHDFHISFYVTPGSGQNEYFSRICMHISHPLCIYSGKKTQNIWNVLFIFLSLHRQSMIDYAAECGEQARIETTPF
jgi:hypothetical protein